MSTGSERLIVNGRRLSTLQRLIICNCYPSQYPMTDLQSASHMPTLNAALMRRYYFHETFWLAVEGVARHHDKQNFILRRERLTTITVILPFNLSGS